VPPKVGVMPIAISSAGQNHGANARIVLDAIEHRHQLIDEPVAQRIELVRAVQRQQRNSAARFRE
jgi:hypothetical protein